MSARQEIASSVQPVLGLPATMTYREPERIEQVTLTRTPCLAIAQDATLTTVHNENSVRQESRQQPEVEVRLQEEERAHRHLVFAAGLAAATSMMLSTLVGSLEIYWLATVTGSTGVVFAAIAYLAHRKYLLEANRIVLWIVTVGAIAVAAVGSGRDANIQAFLLPVVPALFLIHPSTRQRAGIIGGLGTMAVLLALEAYWQLASPQNVFSPPPPQWYGSFTPLSSLLLLLMVTLYHRGRTTLLHGRIVRAQQAAEEAAGAQKRFVDHAAHDLRTPLHAIAGFSEKLRRGQGSAPKAVEEIERATKLLGLMIDDILAYTAGSAPTPEARGKPIEVGALTEEIAELLRGAGLRVEFTLPSDKVWAFADATRTWHVILSVIAEATTHQSDKLPMRVQVEASESTVNINVARTRTSATLAESIGLQRAAEWLHRMGGSIEETPDAYGLRLPRAWHGGEVSLAPERKSGSHETVLAVDDNPVNLVLLSACLTELGVSYETATNGLLAVERWKKGGIGLILMDYSMPTLDGAQATASIRTIEGELGSRRVPIIGVTANTEDSGVCLTAGMDEVVPKPFGIEQLKAALTRWNVSIARRSLNGSA